MKPQYGVTSGKPVSSPSETRRWLQLNRQIANCQQCPRLVRHCQQVAREKRRSYQDWEYWGRAVANFGIAPAQVLIVGLAPAAHGANRTGRMFTGDRSGDWLYRALHKAGFATHNRSVTRDDDLQLVNCVITAVCHCAPPANKPATQEIANCQSWLDKTFDLCDPKILIALGGLAWNECRKLVRRQGCQLNEQKTAFAHGAQMRLAENRYLLGSYHPSQQNTFTGRLTEEMFDHVFSTARQLLNRY